MIVGIIVVGEEMLRIFLWCYIVTMVVTGALSAIPPFVQICHRSDPNLNDCIRESIISLKDRIPTGLPEFFVPAIDPLIVPEIKLDKNSGAIFLHSLYKDIEIHGLSNHAITDLNVDLVNYTLSVGIYFPAVQLKAKYSIDGKIMMMPLTGDGDCRANFTDVDVTGFVSCSSLVRNNQMYLKVNDIQITYDIGGTSVRLDNLFNGDNSLGDRMNVFLNDNWQALSDEVRPVMQNAIAEVIRSSVDKLFEAYSFDELLPE